MNEIPKAIADLIIKHLNDELNDQEKQELDNWAQQSEDHQRFFRQMTGEETLAATLSEYETSKGIVYDKIKEAIVFNKPAKTKLKSIWRFTAVAASILLIAGAVVLWSINKKDKPVAATRDVPVTR